METKKQEEKGEKVMPEYNEGTLKPGKGAGKRLTRQQAVSIRWSEAVMKRTNKQ